MSKSSLEKEKGSHVTDETEAQSVGSTHDRDASRQKSFTDASEFTANATTSEAPPATLKSLHLRHKSKPLPPIGPRVLSDKYKPIENYSSSYVAQNPATTKPRPQPKPSHKPSPKYSPKPLPRPSPKLSAKSSAIKEVADLETEEEEEEVKSEGEETEPEESFWEDLWTNGSTLQRFSYCVIGTIFSYFLLTFFTCLKEQLFREMRFIFHDTECNCGRR